MPHKSTKTFGHEVGLSVCFRQHRAESHCRFLHGYALGVSLTFGASQLNQNGWVMDFGGLGQIKEWLKSNFDHTTVVALDDPLRDSFIKMHNEKMMQVVFVDGTGCEAFAKFIFDKVETWLKSQGNRVWIDSVEVREHGANSAIYFRAQDRVQPDF